MSSSPRVLVVGAGIVGLATAYALLRAEPRLAVTVIDKEPHLAAHQSGHNSGVIHSAINYTPGSAKARMARGGARLLYEFCEEHGVPARRSGKLVVAVSERDEARLPEYERRAALNGLDGVTRLSAGDLREREPRLRGRAALWVPQTGVVDFRRVAQAYADEVRRLGGEVLLGRELLDLRDRSGFSDHAGHAETSGGPLPYDVVVVCAGLQSDRLARRADLDVPVTIVPFRGSYVQMTGAAATLLSTTVYPVPDPRLPFLGVHFTHRYDGTWVAGPNAVPALSREGYLGAGVRARRRDLAETVRSGGFWRLAALYWRDGVAEIARDGSRRLMLRAMREFLPDLDARDLAPAPAATGVRAQAVTRDGSLVDDFLILESATGVFVLNAPSPAATASLSIGQEIASRVRTRLA